MKGTFVQKLLKTLKKHKCICWPEFELLFIYPMECGQERKSEANSPNQPLIY